MNARIAIRELLPLWVEDIGVFQAAAHALELDIQFSALPQRRGPRKHPDFYVQKKWVAEIRPPTAPPACLAHVVLAPFDNDHAEGCGAKTVLCVPDGLRFGILGPVHHDLDWTDPVTDILTKLDLWSGGGEIPFGGFSYKLWVCTAQLRTAIELGTAAHSTTRVVACAMLDVAKSLALGSVPAVVAAFLDQWSKGLGRPGP